MELQKGDITKLHVNVIVNAANTTHLESQGAVFAIHNTDVQSIIKQLIEIRKQQNGRAAG